MTAGQKWQQRKTLKPEKQNKPFLRIPICLFGIHLRTIFDLRTPPGLHKAEPKKSKCINNGSQTHDHDTLFKFKCTKQFTHYVIYCSTLTLQMENTLRASICQLHYNNNLCAKDRLVMQRGCCMWKEFSPNRTTTICPHEQIRSTVPLLCNKWVRGLRLEANAIFS